MSVPFIAYIDYTDSELAFRVNASRKRLRIESSRLQHSERSQTLSPGMKEPENKLVLAIPPTMPSPRHSHNSQVSH